MSQKRFKIGIIGFGNMGSAIAERIKSKYKVFVFDKDRSKTDGLQRVNVADNIIELMGNTDAVILAVKPQDFDSVLNEIKDYAKNKLIISIAAGITTSYIEKHLGDVKVIRVMPNLPAKIGKGMICLCLGNSATKEDLYVAEKLFKNLGKTLIIKEDMMDAATAVSGSGPGFYFDIIESQREDYKKIRRRILHDFIAGLTQAAQDVGFNRKDARLLANTTGAATDYFYLLLKSNLSATELKSRVASKGGTTEAGLEVLHKGGSLREAVAAAKKRAGELSRKE